MKKKNFRRVRNLKQVMHANAADRAAERAVRSVSDEQYRKIWGCSIDDHVERMMKVWDRLYYYHCTPEGRLMAAILKNPRLRAQLLQDRE